MRIRIYESAVSILLICALAACDNDDSGESTDGGTDSGNAADASAGDTDTTVESIEAPDEYSVVIRFAGDVDKSMVENRLNYRIDSDAGTLAVESVDFDVNDKTATLETVKQKLGVNYHLDMLEKDASVDDLEGDFPAADTASFWVSDFSDPTGMTDYEISTTRAKIGKHCVIYVEQGYNPAGVSEAVRMFDERAYPIETDLFTPAPDVDGNGRIVLLGLDGGNYYGGFYNPVNEIPDEQSMELWGMHSNEMEIVHINIIYGDFDITHQIIPHEFQHLLYHHHHGLQWEYWAYHDEGLAECATRAVKGEHQYAVEYYFSDISGLIGQGLSMVNWVYASYDHYVLAFMFWSYIASQLEGVETYGDIFDLPVGRPDTVNDFLLDEMGTDFPTVQMRGLISNRVQAQSGMYGYGNLLDLDYGNPPGVTGGTTSVDLQPFSGAFFSLGQDTVDYPGTRGEHIVYAGINGDGDVDLEAPFDISDGVLLVFNSNFEFSLFESEHSGPDIPAEGLKKCFKPCTGEAFPAWLNPPPINPLNPEPMQRWRQRIREIQRCPGLPEK